MTRTRKSGRSQARALRWLRFEPLEHRLLLALAAFKVNLYEDLGGTPGNLITDDTVQVGETFFAEITARELDPRRAGFQGVALDIAWDPNVLKEIDTPFDPGSLITPNLPLFLTGTLDNTTGAITDLGGSAFPASNTGRTIGNLAPERFALLHFQALEPATNSLFRMSQGFSRIAPMPVASLGSSQIDFESQTITVVPGHGFVGAEAVTSTTQIDAVPSAPTSMLTDANQIVTPNSEGMLDLQPAVDESTPVVATAAAQPVEAGTTNSPPATGDDKTDGTPTAATPTASDGGLSASPGAGDSAMLTVVVSAAWHNPANPKDVSGGGGVTPLDALMTVNYINAHPDSPTLPNVQVAAPPYYDVNGDGFCTGHDVLLVINGLASSGKMTSGAEGEAGNVGRTWDTTSGTDVTPSGADSGVNGHGNARPAGSEIRVPRALGLVTIEAEVTQPGLPSASLMVPVASAPFQDFNTLIPRGVHAATPVRSASRVSATPRIGSPAATDAVFARLSRSRPTPAGPADEFPELVDLIAMDGAL